jgi:hypothetical protein
MDTSQKVRNGGPYCEKLGRRKIRKEIGGAAKWVTPDT